MKSFDDDGAQTNAVRRVRSKPHEALRGYPLLCPFACVLPNGAKILAMSTETDQFWPNLNNFIIDKSFSSLVKFR